MVFKTSYQKKSAIVTMIVMALVVFLLFFCGLKFLDPPEEYGVAIRFGTADVGFGTPKFKQTIQSSPKNTPVTTPKQVVKNNRVVQEKILTQTDVDAPALEAKKRTTKKVVKKIPEKKVNKKQPNPKKTPEIKKVPSPTKATQNALNQLFGNPSKGATAQSEGNDDLQGVKGSASGDPNSEKYYGNGGLGGDGNYLLKGRRTLSKPIEKPNCNEEGIVVVRIEVNQNGKVLKAVAGVKGTTNNSACLLVPAKKAALATQWNPDGNAPNKQVGYIRYQFILAE